MKVLMKWAAVLLCLGLFIQKSRAQITNPAPYCTCTYTFQYNMFASITVNTGVHTLGASMSNLQYTYYTNQTFPNMIIGGNNTISIVSYAVNDAEPMYFAVYIDINHNNTFDADEVFMQNSNTINTALATWNNPATQTVAKTFTIPATALAGQTRMRIARGGSPVAYNPAYTLSPCGIATFSYGICYDYNVNLVAAGPITPVAAFTGNPLAGQTNVTNITFTDATTNAPTAWAWSFTPNNVAYQNGTTAASQNPVVKFTQAGTYTVALTTTNAAGNNTLTKNNYITITNPPAPVAAFTANNLNPTTGVSTVTLTDQSTNGATTWQWTITPNTVTYQNGTSATSQNPQVLFTANGTYTVKLKATNTVGSDSLTKTNYITAVAPQAPDAAFIANTLSGITNVTNVTLTDQSLHNPTSWNWTFTPNNVVYQNGTSATSQNPVVKFTQTGVYTVKLMATNIAGTDSAVQANYITIIDSPVVADFSVNIDHGNATQTQFSFTDLTTNNPTAWAWSFTPNTVTYLNGTNASSQNPQVTFDNPGNYTVKLVASKWGSADSVKKVGYVSVLPAIRAPEADFTADVTNAVKNQTTVSFSDQSDYVPTSWKWTIVPNTYAYVNGTNATDKNPKIIFTADGTYTIKLKATNDLGSDSITKAAYITVGVTGIKEQAAGKILSIFPNPANNYLNFELQQGVKLQSVAIVNLEGKVIAEYNQPKENRINISSLSKGVYFLKMTFEGESNTAFKKFSKL